MSFDNQEGRKRSREDFADGDEEEEEVKEEPRRPRLDPQQWRGPLADHYDNGVVMGGQTAPVDTGLAASRFGVGDSHSPTYLHHLLRQSASQGQGEQLLRRNAAQFQAEQLRRPGSESPGHRVGAAEPNAWDGDHLSWLLSRQPPALSLQPNLTQRSNLGGGNPFNFPMNFSGLTRVLDNPQLSTAAQSILMQQFRGQSGWATGADTHQRLSGNVLAALSSTGATGERRPDPPAANQVERGLGTNSNMLRGNQGMNSDDILSRLSAARQGIPMSSASAGRMHQALGGYAPAYVSGALPPLQQMGGARSAPLLSAAGGSRVIVGNQAIGRRSMLLYVATDDDSVNGYQCYARKQIELFEATQDDVDAGAQGRNKPIILGQVGIRCRHCADLHPRFRTRAAVYYPSRLAVLYQAAQNIVNVHLPELCESISAETRDHLQSLDNKRSAVGGGKNYWSDTARAQGVVDTENGLRMADNPMPPKL